MKDIYSNKMECDECWRILDFRKKIWEYLDFKLVCNVCHEYRKEVTKDLKNDDFLDEGIRYNKGGKE